MNEVSCSSEDEFSESVRNTRACFFYLRFIPLVDGAAIIRSLAFTLFDSAALKGSWSGPASDAILLRTGRAPDARGPPGPD